MVQKVIISLIISYNEIYGVVLALYPDGLSSKAIVSEDSNQRAISIRHTYVRDGRERECEA